MNLGDILKTVGTGLIASIAGPAAPLIIAGINGFLPGDKQLPENATGEQAQSAINSLSPELQASVLEKEYDVKKEEIRGFTDRFKAMAEVDATGNTTRPQIALMMAQVVCFTIVVTVSMWAYAVITKNDVMISTINDSWMLIGAIIATPSALLRAYFAMRTKEKQQKYEAATGVSAPISLLAGLFKK